MSATTKKGQFACLKQTHTSTGVNFKTTTYHSFHLVRVESATRNGIATSYCQYIGNPTASKVGPSDQILTMPYHQDAALKMWVRQTSDQRMHGYESAEAFKAAILEFHNEAIAA